MSDEIPRRADRVPLEAEVRLRRTGSLPYRTQIMDLSTLGCRVEFVERPVVDEHVWVRFDGLEAVEARVRWVDGFAVGLEFLKPLHTAVFERLISGR